MKNTCRNKAREVSQSVFLQRTKCFSHLFDVFCKRSFVRKIIGSCANLTMIYAAIDFIGELTILLSSDIPQLAIPRVSSGITIRLAYYFRLPVPPVPLPLGGCWEPCRSGYNNLPLLRALFTNRTRRVDRTRPIQNLPPGHRL